MRMRGPGDDGSTSIVNFNILFFDGHVQDPRRRFTRSSVHLDQSDVSRELLGLSLVTMVRCDPHLTTDLRRDFGNHSRVGTKPG